MTEQAEKQRYITEEFNSMHHAETWMNQQVERGYRLHSWKGFGSQAWCPEDCKWVPADKICFIMERTDK